MRSQQAAFLSWHERRRAVILLLVRAGLRRHSSLCAPRALGSSTAVLQFHSQTKFTIALIRVLFGLCQRVCCSRKMPHVRSPKPALSCPPHGSCSPSCLPSASFSL